MRRTRLLTYLIALTTLVTGALVFTSPGASAETAEPEMLTEAWFGRAKEEDPQAPVPCLPEETPDQVPPQGCGPISPADFPAPQAKSTGHYVVASAGGEAGDDDAQGDTAWAAFEFDMFDYLESSVDKFVVRLHLGMDRCQTNTQDGKTYCANQGDTYGAVPGTEVPPVQACNITEAWSGEAGANPWGTRPAAGATCVAGKVNPDNFRQFVFDLTGMAQDWVDGKGYGFVVRPGTPDEFALNPNDPPEEPPDLEPFQITFSGFEDAGTNSAGCTKVGAPGVPVTGVPRVPPQTVPQQGPGVCTTTDIAPEPIVTFAYTPPFEDDDDFFDDDDLDGGGFDEDISEDFGDDEGFEAEPDLDVIPTDVGSEELPEDLGDETAVATDDDGDLAAPTRRRTRPISNTPFPWAVLFLLPLVAVAFWGTGTALGPIGDPVAARRGGVSRVLAERQAANRGSDFDPRNRA